MRQAVNYAVDPAALERIYAGQIAGTQQILPPGMPGYEKFELYPHDMAKAKQLIDEANPSDRDITVWGDNESENEAAVTYYQDVLEELGFNATLKILSRQLLHGDRQPEHAGPRHRLVRLVPGLPAPERLLPAAAGGGKHPPDQQHQLRPNRRTRSSTRKSPNSAKNRSGPSRKPNTRALDKRYMEQAPWAPYGNRTVSTFVSSAIDLDKVIFNPTFGQDLTSFQFK